MRRSLTNSASFPRLLLLGLCLFVLSKPSSFAAGGDEPNTLKNKFAEYDVRLKDILDKLEILQSKIEDGNDYHLEVLRALARTYKSIEDKTEGNAKRRAESMKFIEDQYRQAIKARLEEAIKNASEGLRAIESGSEPSQAEEGYGIEGSRAQPARQHPGFFQRLRLRR